MSDPKPRAWQYMGPGEYVEGIPFGEHVKPGDHYVAWSPMHPDDIPLAPPTEVTAEDVTEAWRTRIGFVKVPGRGWDKAIAEFLNERLAARQKGDHGRR